MLENDGILPSGGQEPFTLSGNEPSERKIERADIDLVCLYFSRSFNSSVLIEPVRSLFDLSFNAFDIFIHAWMSELPVEAEIAFFGRKVIATAQTGGSLEEKRIAAERAACDRADADTLTVLRTAEKVQHEIHRMTGLLRFFHEKDKYIARCAPDHFIIPALGEYFTARFGETAWAIIDEKRMLRLSSTPGENAVLVQDDIFAAANEGDEWEELWRHYHKTINNESRKNTNLQRQFMPKRYWKYLPEV
ncbi:MAG: TIGR03915 family putative DNA repair protein [Treponema sp.]|jgi:hypothetical protein|nr:TIGR03915 family putative DNA repair protein [Treponema sp.]